MNTTEFFGDPQKWHDLEIKAYVNMYKHNQEWNLLYGILGCLGIDEISFLERLDIIETIGEDFYRFKDNSSEQLWENIKKNCLLTHLKGQGYRAQNRDIILSSIHKAPRFADQYQSTWESINNIKIDQEAMEVYNKMKAFDKIIY